MNNNSSGGIGVTGLLLITFIVLKLTEVIAWSWLWVLSPAWIPLSILIIILVIWLVVKLIKKLMEVK